MKLHIQTLSPVHIGSGAEIPPSEYWFDPHAGLVCRLNLESLVKDPAFLPHLDKYVRGAREARQIDGYVPIEVLTPHTLYRLPALGEARGQLALHPTVIKAQVLSGGRAFIPGSSLKGSLLSGALWHLLGQEAKTNLEVKEKVAKAMKVTDSRDSVREYAGLLALGLGLFCRGDANRFQQWLSVSDTNLLLAQGNIAVTLVQVVGSRQGGQIPVLMETLRSGVCLVFELNRPPGACQNKPPNKGHGPEDLVKMADAFYRRVWAKTEKDPPPDGGWLLRLGQGSGAWATSMLLLAEDLDLNYSISPPHTKKMVDGRESLGWVLLSPAGDEAPPAFPQPLPPRPQAATAAPAPAAADGTAEAPAAAAVDGTAEAAQPARGPSPKLQDLLARIGVTKPHDAGRVGMFLDGLQALEDAEKAELARAILNRFGNKLLKRHKRWQELAPYF